MKKAGGKMLMGFLFFIIVFVLYVFWDNNRFVVIEQEIVINNLPEQLQDFRILQISDLHEHQFGDQQTGLIEAINAADYDAIVFTGDMLDDKESTDYVSFYTLIEGIDNKENAWFVPGNTDPDSYQIGSSVEKSDFILGMEERGVKLLETMDSVAVNDENIHFINFELSIIANPEYIGKTKGIVRPDYNKDSKYHEHQAALWEEITLPERGVVVALNHYPVPDVRIDHIKNNPDLKWLDYDLILAGHYHGGQIRLPVIGALFVPEPWYKPNSFFPPRDRVSGLWEYTGTKQYVSRGLGSSDAISFLNFRLFNTPEINMLILK
ncbi:metallophosphoesterase [Virgibacillus oceani]